jgi:hypothetical protein
MSDAPPAEETAPESPEPPAPPAPPGPPAPPEPPEPPEPELTTSEETITAWAAYAKDRFDAASKRVDEFRNWARQLAGVIGVVIGFEFTLTGRTLDLKPPFDPSLRTLALAIFLVTIAFQIYLLFRVLRIGYGGQHVLGPESPTILAKFVADKDARTTKQVLGAYYAKAADTFHELSESLGSAVTYVSLRFSRSLIALLVGLLILVALATKSYTGPAMADSTSTPAPGPAASPAPAAPQASPVATAPASPAPSAPLLVTPTPGRVERFTAQPPAPTPGRKP